MVLTSPAVAQASAIAHAAAAITEAVQSFPEFISAVRFILPCSPREPRWRRLRRERRQKAAERRALHRVRRRLAPDWAPPVAIGASPPWPPGARALPRAIDVIAYTGAGAGWVVVGTWRAGR